MISEVPRVAPKPLPKFRIGALVALAGALAFTAWLLVHHFSAASPTPAAVSHPPTPAAVSRTPTPKPKPAPKPAAAAATTSLAAVSAGQLASTAASLGHPIYWAGPMSRMTYELTLLADGSSSVRYLPPGVPVGDPRPYLQIATWKFAHAFAATRHAASRAGTVKLNVGPGAVAFYDADRPIDVWEAFKGLDYQVEVFAPSAQEAQQIVTGGEIQDAGSAAAAAVALGPVAATPAELAATAKRLGHPVFWSGPKRSGTYELTETPNGRVYVRYLPPGAQVGTAVAYFTIGTYPLKDAYSITKDAASRPNTTKIPLRNGVAFYNNTRPNSIYVAFHGTDEQVEIYDPAATKGRAFADAEKIARIP